ncbi:MAG: hypothetical protein ACE5NN_07270 [Candidatus Bathyarchaeia archaeon]
MDLWKNRKALATTLALTALVILSSTVFVFSTIKPALSESVEKTPSRDRNLSSQTTVIREPPPHKQFGGLTITAVSFVPDVSVNSVTLVDEGELKVGLRFSDEEAAPSATVVAFTQVPYRIAVQPMLAEQGMPMKPAEAYPVPYQPWALVGSSILRSGWTSPAELSFDMVGEESLLETTLLQIIVIPYTGE